MKAEAQASGLLGALLRESERRAAAARMDRVRVERAAASAKAPPDFPSALAGSESVAVIAEIKRRSPSAGPLLGAGEVVPLARALAAGGAAALSVLTEPAHFAGSLEDLSRVAAAVAVPVLRKDFILDAVQLYEARASGAAAVLLIVRILGPGRLEELSAVARQLGLACLVEVRGSAELDAALSAKAAIVGINARDLDTLVMDPRLVESLLPAVPADRVAVAESGLTVRADVERVAAKGADAVLVGAAISGAADPAGALRAMTGVRRRSRAGVRK
jgi:indole-3-glycerol phosphate synthase